MIMRIKGKIAEHELDDDKMDELKKMNEDKNKNYIVFAKLVVLAYDTISESFDFFDEREVDFKKLSEYLINLESITQINYLRNAIYSYQYGEGIGDHYLEMNIADNIMQHRKSYLGLIRLFFKLFGEE